MSSRARLVNEEIRPYDWRGARLALMPAQPIVEPTEVPEVPEESQAPEGSGRRHEQRLAEIEHAAFAKGHEEGVRGGAAAAATAAHGLLQRLAETIETLSSTRQDMLRRTERQVVALAMAIARQMLQREVTVDRALLLAMARVALDRLGDHDAATIRLHPDDYAAVNASPNREWASDQVTVVADSTVERGGCLVECDAGRMAVGLDSQFNELARTLLGEPTGDPR